MSDAMKVLVFIAIVMGIALGLRPIPRTAPFSLDAGAWCPDLYLVCRAPDGGAL